MIQERNPVTIHYTHCTKCGMPIIKWSKKIKEYCLSEYEPRENLCWGCNATNSVIARLKAGGSIDKEELTHLPRYLVFDPRDNDPEEASYGMKYSEMIKKYNEEYETKQILELAQRAENIRNGKCPIIQLKEKDKERNQ